MGDEFNKVEIFDKDNKLIDRDIVNWGDFVWIYISKYVIQWLKINEMCYCSIGSNKKLYSNYPIYKFLWFKKIRHRIIPWIY
jgi:hypothetical protein